MFNTASLSHLEDLIEDQSETAETIAQTGIDAAPSRQDAVEALLRNDDIPDSVPGLFCEVMSGSSCQEIFSMNVSNSDVSEFLGNIELVTDAA